MSGSLAEGNTSSAPDDRRDMPAPPRAIRCFDVFTEYTRQARFAKGDAEDQDHGYES